MNDDPIRPVAVEPRNDFRIWIKFQDGQEGEIDLSHLAGNGIFKAWNDRAFFESVRINSYDEVAWGDDIDLCPDSLYMQLTGKPVEEIWPRLAIAKINA